MSVCTCVGYAVVHRHWFTTTESISRMYMVNRERQRMPRTERVADNCGRPGGHLRRTNMTREHAAAGRCGTGKRRPTGRRTTGGCAAPAQTRSFLFSIPSTAYSQRLNRDGRKAIVRSTVGEKAREAPARLALFFFCFRGFHDRKINRD